MVTVSYRPGLEHSYMRAPGGLRYALGKADGLSKPYVWAKGNNHTVEMTDADAKRMQQHNDERTLGVVRETDWNTGKSLGDVPEFLIGEKAIKEWMDPFKKRYDEYAANARALAEADSDDLFAITEPATPSAG